MKADFDISYTKIKKEENSYTLSYLVKFHIGDKYSNNLKMVTDGSALQNVQAGAGFITT